MAFYRPESIVYTLSAVGGCQLFYPYVLLSYWILVEKERSEAFLFQ